MRVALVRQRYNPYGGAERFVERAIQALEREGTEVTLITRFWESEGARRALIVDPPYAGRLWRDASFAWAVKRIVGKGRFDLVQTHERISGCDVYRAGDGVHRQWLDNRLRSAPAFERLGIRINPYHWYVCAAERSMFEHPGLRAVICNSKMVAKEIRQHFAIAPAKINVIYNGVDLDHFHPARRNALRAEGRARLGYGERDTVFSFVGSGFSRKGLGAAIDALAQTGRSDLKLAVAGRDRSTANFAAQARRAGVGDRVAFLGGLDDVRFVYAASDCFILPTRYDPFPNAALEALAMGVPIIVSSQCGAAELVEQGVNGWVCEPDRGEVLAKIMTQVPGIDRPRISGNARLSAESFGIEKMANLMIELYRALSAQATGTHGGR